jgi:hypothetical protein
MDHKKARILDLTHQLESNIVAQNALKAEKLEIESELISLLDHPQDKTRTYELGDKKLTISANWKREWDQDQIVDWSKDRPELLEYFKIEYKGDTDKIKRAREEGREIAQYLADCQKVSIGKPSFKVVG